MNNKLDENKSVKSNNTNDDNKSKWKSLTNREKAFYELSQSMVLELRERIFFSRMTEKLRSLTSVKDIQKANDAYIKNKVKELEQKILNYNNALNIPFTPSKFAMISTNLIMEKMKMTLLILLKIINL